MNPYEKLCDSLREDPKCWLITGVAGFIGSALLEQLLSLDQTVVGLDNFATGHRRNLDDATANLSADQLARFRFVEGDIRDLETCQRVCQDMDYVLHEAALGSVPRSIAAPLDTHGANVDGFLNIMLGAKVAHVRRVVYASSSSVYGDHPALPKVEENIGRQLSPYAVSKYIGELYAGVVQDCYGLESIGLRYFNVYGRRQDPHGPYAAVIPRWIGNLLHGEPCVIFGDGSNSRDFTYVDDVVQANLLCALTPETSTTNRAYNVGAAGRTNLLQLFKTIRDVVALSHPHVEDTRPHHTEPRAGDVLHSQASIQKLCDAVGYRPTHDLRSGLSKTVAWFAAHPAADQGKLQ